MFSKTQFLDSVRHETRICQHLFSKLNEGQLDYRPGESMRSTRELLRYLTYCAVGPAEAQIRCDWSCYKTRVEAGEALEAADFPARMERQATELEELLAGISEDDLKNREVTVPWGARMSLGAGLVNQSLKYLAAYRMQLFLHAKASGSAELNTWNNWAGADAPPDAG